MMTHHKFISLFTLVIATSMLLGTCPAKAQSPISSTPNSPQSATPSPTSSPTPTPSPPVSPQEQKLSAQERRLLDERLDNLEDEVKGLSGSSAGLWKIWNGLVGIATGFFQAGWLVFAIAALMFFKGPISEILKALPPRIHSLTLKYNGFELSTSDVNEIVLEREILKTMISVSMADNSPDPEELAYIATRSKSMHGKLDVLTREDKMRIVEAAIQLAVADRIFKDSEYGAIKMKADQYQISDADLKKMVERECQSYGVALPPQLNSSSNP